MNELPEDDLEETRAAMAPTLDATAAILPWLKQPKPPRFDKKLNQRWIEACKLLTKTWSERYDMGDEPIRPAIFALYGIALETVDNDCLRLGEALASATDQLETAPPTAQLIAAMSAAIECLGESGGLEHPAFPERARHFTQRLENAVSVDTTIDQRSPVLDRLFIEDAVERLELMHDALAVLPPDAYALKTEAATIATQAEHLALYGIMHLARQLAARIDVSTDLDAPETRQVLESLLGTLSEAIAAVNP